VALAVDLPQDLVKDATCRPVVPVADVAQRQRWRQTSYTTGGQSRG
jgi:hypothetical protein